MIDIVGDVYNFGASVSQQIYPFTDRKAAILSIC